MTSILQKTSVRRTLGTFVQAWIARSPREKLLLALVGGLILFALVFSSINWISHEQHRLERAMPSRQAQLLEVQAAATELEQLRSRPAVSVSSGPELARIIAESARAHGLDLRIAENRDGLLGEGRAPFDQLIDWLGKLNQEFALRIEKLDIQREAGGAIISATLMPAALQ